MIQSANKYQISDIFNPDANVKYVVPKYQREYVWGKEDWDNLFNDLIDNEKGHFLGSIICINKSSDVLDINPLEVIDGQQRLTTISLLYLAIYEKLLKFGIDHDDDFIATRTNLKYRLIQRSNKDEIKLELSYQNNNLNDYRYILKELNLLSDANKPSNLGNRRIYKAFRYFKSKIEQCENVDQVVDYLDKINSALLVKIEVDSHADAFILFESLNNRGQALSAIDLIKNKLLSELEKNSVTTVDSAFKKWVKLVNYLPDYKAQERFLRHFYNAFRYKDEIRTKKHSYATRSSLIKIYDVLIEKNPSLIFNELIEKAEIYNSLICPNEKSGSIKGLNDLNNLGATPSFAFLLYLYSEHSANSALINSCIDFLVKYTVRRNLTDFPNTRDLDRIFINLIDECEKNHKGIDLELIKNFLTHPSRYSDDDIFKRRLRGNIYEENAPVARFILCKIEESYQTRENKKDLWEKNNKGAFIWTVEHIFPEGENIPNDWVNMIANGDKELAKALQMEHVHKLGNLTISAYNANLSNSSFNIKLNKKDKNGNYIGFKNGLFLNSEIVNKDTWTVDHIIERTESLATKAFSLFDVK